MTYEELQVLKDNLPTNIFQAPLEGLEVYYLTDAKTALYLALFGF